MARQATPEPLGATAVSGVLIVGGGQAGVECAAQLRIRGFSGPITIVSQESSSIQRPPLSKTYLTGTATAADLALRSEVFFAREEITVIKGRLDRIDHEHKVGIVGGQRIPYEHLVLATGGTPRRLEIPGSDAANIRYLRTAEDADALREALRSAKRLLIVGGGYIGLEVAASARTMGADVVVVEAAPRLLARSVPEIVSDYYLDLHTHHGVEARFGTSAERFIIGSDGLATSMTVDDGTVIDFDVCLVGIGLIPDIQLAVEVGVEARDGILVDEFTRTSVPGIYAIGDCASSRNRFGSGTGRIESVSNAVDQAKVAASVITGDPQPYQTVPWFWSDQYDAHLKTVGLVSPGDSIQVEGEVSSGSFAVMHSRDGEVTAVTTVNRPREFAMARRELTPLYAALGAPSRSSESEVDSKVIIQ